MVKIVTLDGETTRTYAPPESSDFYHYPDGETETIEYNGEGQVVSKTDKCGHKTTYVLDGNDNLLSKTDSDGYTTEYTYNALDLVSHINYNGGKQVDYVYNAVGDLVRMDDWTGTNTFEYDLLSQLKKVTDTKGNVVEYTYDGNGNQASMTYPDGSVVNYTYDGVGNLKTVTESDGRTTTYSYDGMGRVVEMVYPHGWVETYHYDTIGQLLKVEDTDPSGKDMKQQKHVYEYDACGNMTYEYMRGNGTGEATVENFYTYDALHRVVNAKENYGNATRSYQYDSLGNLTWETNSNNVTVDYILNNLNQITSSTEDGWKTSTAFTYDARGNLVSEVYTKNKKVTTLGAYIYDETNKMVSGTNEGGEVSNYIYNGLGALVENQWIITKNGYGYHSVDAGDVEITYPATNLKKSSTVVKQFVVDYNTETFEPLMEHEVNGLDYKYVYGNDRLSVDITSVTNSMSIVENGDHVRLYYHMDYLGTADYLTSPVSLKVTSWTHYNEWGEITHNAVLKCGQRELDLVKRYATHDYDNVLDLYYAKARFYDADNRRFVAVDPILDPSQYDIREYVDDPMQMVQYLYVSNRPLAYIDPTGEEAVTVITAGGAALVFAYGEWLIWSNSPQGKETINNATALIYDGISYVGSEIAAFTAWALEGAFELGSGVIDGIKVASETIAGGISWLGTKASETFADITSYFVKPTCEEETIEGIGDIAGKYGNFECVQAANAIKAYLLEKKQHGSIIIINFMGGPGYVVSLMYNDKVISENGMHQGVYFAGKVYCNVHPYGLPKAQWIDDFDGLGLKTVREIQF